MCIPAAGAAQRSSCDGRNGMARTPLYTFVHDALRGLRAMPQRLGSSKG